MKREFERDLTAGNEYKVLLMFTLPIFLSNLMQQLYGIADSVIVGRTLGEEALAVVGASYNISNIILAVSMGITIGFSILISRMYGGKNYGNIQNAIDNGIFLMTFLAVFITVLGIAGSHWLMNMFHVPENIMQHAAIFLMISFIGTVPSFGFNAVSNFLRGVGDSRTSLIVIFISSILNILLDLLFIICFRFGVSGAAIATMISQYVSFIGIIIYVNRNDFPFKIRWKGWKLDLRIIKESLEIGIPAMLQQLFLGLGGSVIQYLINGYGSIIISAYTAASKIESFATLPAVNIGKSMSNYIAQNKGAGKDERVRRGIKAGVIIIISFSVLLIVIILFGAKDIIRLFCEDSKVCKAGVTYLQIVCCFYCVFGVMQLLNGVLIGLGKANLSLWGSILSFCLLQVPVAVILSKLIGVNGIWIAAPIGWIGGLLLRIVFMTI